MSFKMLVRQTLDDIEIVVRDVKVQVKTMHARVVRIENATTRADTETAGIRGAIDNAQLMIQQTREDVERLGKTQRDSFVLIGEFLREQAQVYASTNRHVEHHLQIITQYLGENMSDIAQLREAIAANAAAASEATTRVIAKITELGEPDPDLSADIALLQSTTAQLQSIASTDTPDPGEPDYVPGDAEAPTEAPVGEGENVGTPVGEPEVAEVPADSEPAPEQP